METSKSLMLKANGLFLKQYLDGVDKVLKSDMDQSTIKNGTVRYVNLTAKRTMLSLKCGTLIVNINSSTIKNHISHLR